MLATIKSWVLLGALRTFTDKNAIRVGFSRDGEAVYTCIAGEIEEFIMWNLSGEIITEMGYPSSGWGWEMIQVALSNDKVALCGADDNGTCTSIKIYSIEKQGFEPEWTITQAVDNEMELLLGGTYSRVPTDPRPTYTISPDGRRRVELSSDRRVSFIEEKSKRRLATFHLDGEPVQLNFIADGSRLVILMSNGAARVWDIRSIAEKREEIAARAKAKNGAEAYVDKLWAGSIPTKALNQHIYEDKNLSPLIRIYAERALGLKSNELQQRVTGILQSLTNNYVSSDQMLSGAKGLELPERIQTELISEIKGLSAAPTEVVGEIHQWASEVLDFSSQFGNPEWSAQRALGFPNTLYYGDWPSAWAPRNPDGGMQYLVLGFPKAVYATGLSIRETNCNGFVRQVDVVRDDRTRETVWKGNDLSISGAPVNFFISFPPTSFPIKIVRIHVDTDHEDGYEEIDAVKLHGFLPTTATLRPSSQATATRPSIIQPAATQPATSPSTSMDPP